MFVIMVSISSGRKPCTRRSNGTRVNRGTAVPPMCAGHAWSKAGAWRVGQGGASVAAGAHRGGEHHPEEEHHDAQEGQHRQHIGLKLHAGQPPPEQSVPGRAAQTHRECATGQAPWAQRAAGLLGPGPGPEGAAPRWRATPAARPWPPPPPAPPPSPSSVASFSPAAARWAACRRHCCLS